MLHHSSYERGESKRSKFLAGPDRKPDSTQEHSDQRGLSACPARRLRNIYGFAASFVEDIKNLQLNCYSDRC